jgi:hypothetical protein
VSSAVRADLRNLIVEDWTSWGTRFENAASGNVVNSIFGLTAYAAALGGKRDSALRLWQSGPVFSAGNAFRGEARANEPGNATVPVDAAPVTTSSVADMEPLVRARAGCLPRDGVDQAYIDTTTGWDVGQYTPYRIDP